MYRPVDPVEAWPGILASGEEVQCNCDCRMMGGDVLEPLKAPADFACMACTALGENDAARLRVVPVFLRFGIAMHFAAGEDGRYLCVRRRDTEMREGAGERFMRTSKKSFEIERKQPAAGVPRSLGQAQCLTGPSKSDDLAIRQVVDAQP